MANSYRLLFAFSGRGALSLWRRRANRVFCAWKRRTFLLFTTMPSESSRSDFAYNFYFSADWDFAYNSCFSADWFLYTIWMLRLILHIIFCFSADWFVYIIWMLHQILHIILIFQLIDSCTQSGCYIWFCIWFLIFSWSILVHNLDVTSNFANNFYFSADWFLYLIWMFRLILHIIFCFLVDWFLYTIWMLHLNLLIISNF
jgi:hypothetical protein